MPKSIAPHTLLNWQIILLFAALGTLTPFYGAYCLLAAALLILAFLLKQETNYSFTLSLSALIFGAAFALGWVVAQNNLPKLTTTLEFTNKQQAITATVSDVDALPDRRLRIILSDVELKSADASEPTTKLPLDLAWTWKFPTSYPLVGEKIETTLRLRDVRGLDNPGTFNIEEYWLEKHVAYRAWSMGDKTSLTTLDSAPFWQQARGSVEATLISTLEDASGQMSGGKAIILALLMGNRYYLTQQQLDFFAAASLSHSLALSGLHLGLMAALGTGLAFGVCRLRPQIMLRIPRPKLAALFAAPLVLIYLWLGGITPSLCRAALMFACWGILLLRGRKHLLMDGLFWAILIMLLINPLVLHDIRLQLSALCIAAIAVCLPASLHIAQRLCKKQGRMGSFIRSTISLLIISTSIQVVLLPVQTWSFGEATPWFILNLIWLPALSCFVFPMSVAGLIFCLIPPLNFVGSFIFELAALPADGLFALLNFLDAHGLLIAPAVARPWAPSIIAYWSLLGVIIILAAQLLKIDTDTKIGGITYTRAKWLPVSRQISKNIKAAWARAAEPFSKTPAPSLPLIIILFTGWLLCCISLVERWAGEHPEAPRMRLLDVGQGQAIVFEGTGGERILVDGGGLPGGTFDIGKGVIGPSLTRNRAPRLTAVVNTHPDNDHIDGLFYILKKFEVGHVYFGQGLPSGERGEEFRQMLLRRGFEQDLNAKPLRTGQQLKLDRTHSLLVLHPPLELNPDTTSSTLIKADNDYSLSMALIINNKNLNTDKRNLALTCGDIGKSGINMMLHEAEDGAYTLSSQILVLPHHGSKGSFSPGFYKVVNPQIALASAGYDNQWNFPVPAVREELKAQGIPLYSTSEYGQILIEWNKNYELNVSVAKP